MSRQEMERYCYLDDEDRRLIAVRCREYNRLGRAGQIGGGKDASRLTRPRGGESLPAASPGGGVGRCGVTGHGSWSPTPCGNAPTRPRDGENRTVAEMEAEEVGASMKYATVKVAKVERTRRATPTPDAEQGGTRWRGRGTRRSEHPRLGRAAETRRPTRHHSLSQARTRVQAPGRHRHNYPQRVEGEHRATPHQPGALRAQSTRGLAESQ